MSHPSSTCRGQYLFVDYVDLHQYLQACFPDVAIRDRIYGDLIDMQAEALERGTEAGAVTLRVDVTVTTWKLGKVWNYVSIQPFADGDFYWVSGRMTGTVE